MPRPPPVLCARAQSARSLRAVTTGPPEVSVVIPTRDRWHLLEDALATALGQEETTLEVIVVDDGSSDETPARLAALPDPRLRVLRNPRSLGVAAARNRGIAAARATWIAFLDDDDLWSPRKLRSQLDAAATAQAAFAYGGAIVIDESMQVLRHSPAPDPSALSTGLLVRNLIPGGCSNIVATTELVRSVGGFDEDLVALADWDLWIRLAHAGRAASCPDTVVAYRRHADSMVRRGAANMVAEFSYLCAKHRQQSHAAGVTPDRRGFYRYVARAARRSGRRRDAVGLYLRLALRDASGGDLLRAIGTLLGPDALALGARLLPGWLSPAPLGGDEPAWFAWHRQPSPPATRRSVPLLEAADVPE
jgi:glycosyltransferase involved in cell wall biosynthesis